MILQILSNKRAWNYCLDTSFSEDVWVANATKLKYMRRLDGACTYDNFFGCRYRERLALVGELYTICPPELFTSLKNYFVDKSFGQYNQIW